MFVRRLPENSGKHSKGDVIVTYFVAARVARRIKTSSVVALIGLAFAGLGGCETAGSLFGGGPTASNEIAPPPAAATQKTLARVAFSPVIGAPDGIGKQLIAQFGEFAERNRFAVEQDSRQSDYTLRGYVVAAREKSGTKVSYIWDVADNTGKRVNRISGEEMAAGQPNAKDPWANISPALTKAIAEKTASSMGAWLPTQSSGAAPVAAKSAPVVVAQGAGAGAGSVEPQTISGTPGAAAKLAASTNTTTASLPRSDDVAAVVPLVTGAPGDGNSMLSSALQRELSGRVSPWSTSPARRIASKAKSSWGRRPTASSRFRSTGASRIHKASRLVPSRRKMRSRPARLTARGGKLPTRPPPPQRKAS